MSRSSVCRSSTRVSHSFPVVLLLLPLFLSLLGLPPGAARAQGDPAPEARPQEPAPGPTKEEIELRAHLDAADPKEWVRGLTRILPLCQRPAPPSWISQLLREYVIERGGENPGRTRTILDDRVIRTPTPGEDILLEMLQQEPLGPFHDEVRATLSRIASDPMRREGLLKLLERAKLPLLFERLFPVLAHHDPGGAVDLAIGVLAAEEGEVIEKPLEEAVVRALGGFLDLPLEDSGAWQEWWNLHKEDAHLEALLHRRETEFEAEAVTIWERASDLLRAGNPASYRSWLLAYLESSVRPRLRQRALVEVKRFAQRLAGNGNPASASQCRDLLRPLADRSLEIVRGQGEKGAMRLAALDALGEMGLFRDDPEIVSLLDGWIGRLAREAPLTSLERDLGLRSVEVAGRLKAPVGDALDGLLKTIIPARDDGDWGQIPEALLLAVLKSLKETGPRAGTVPLIQRVFHHLERARVPAIQVLLEGVPEGSRGEVLAFFTGVLEDETLGDPRTLAILGLGRLGDRAGIRPLQEVILAPDGTGLTDRSAAVGAIASIGGREAVWSLRNLLGNLPAEEQELREEVIAEARDLCVRDQTLEMLVLFLLGDSAQDRSQWFEEVIETPEVARLLDTGELPTDFIASHGDAFQNWWVLRRELCRLLAERAPGAGVGPEGVQAYRALAASARDVLDFAKDAPAGTFSRRSFQHFELVGSLRAQLLEAVERGDPEALMTGLGRLAAQEQKLFPEAHPEGTPLAGKHLTWLLEALKSREPAEWQQTFLNALERG
ncbi:MAG: hypothetical protein ACE5GW_11595, partial [Planctomycetota bacterium]